LVIISIHSFFFSLAVHYYFSQVLFLFIWFSITNRQSRCWKWWLLLNAYFAFSSSNCSVREQFLSVWVVLFVSFIIFLVVCLFDFLFYRDTIIISSLLLSQNVNHSNNCGQMRGMCKLVKSNCSRIPAAAVVCLRHDYLVQQKSAADREHSTIISRLLCSQPTHSATSLTEPTLPYRVIYICIILSISFYFLLFLLRFIYLLFNY